MAEPASRVDPAQAIGASGRAPEGGLASRGRPFHGWRIVAIGALCHALGFGLIGVVAFVNTPLSAEFGATQLQVGLGVSLAVLSPAMMGPLLGWILDRGPLRVIMLCGLAIMVAGVALIARAQSLGMLGLGFAIVTIGMSMYGQFPGQVMLVNWFVLGRGKALGVAAVGISLAALLVPQLASRLIAALGWRDAVLAMGLCAAAIAAPLFALFAVKRPEEVGQHPDGLPPVERQDPSPRLVEIPLRRILAMPSFWLIGIGAGLAFCASVPGFYLVRYMETELGIAQVQAANVPSTTAVFGLIGKLVAGWAIDRIDKRAVVICVLSLHALGWVIAVQQSTLAGLLLAAVPLGLGGGGFIALPPVLQGACFGRAMIGRISGLHALLGLPFLLAIAPLVGWLQSVTGSFVQPLLGLALVCALAAALFAFVPIPQREPGL